MTDPRRVESRLRELIALTTREPVAYEIVSSGLLTLILAELFAARADRLRFFAAGGPSPPLSESVRKAIDYMIRRYDQPLSVKQLARDVAGRSLNYFSRRFHQEVGISPIAWLNRHRIEQAKQFLASGNQTVEEVARRVGFSDPNYFTRRFVQIVGVTPRAYRRSQRAVKLDTEKTRIGSRMPIPRSATPSLAENTPSQSTRCGRATRAVSARPWP